MAKIRTLIEQGNWYKGNTHSHTTVSDGRLSPEDAVAVYREYGYHWMAITDHGIWGTHDGLQDENFIIFGGTELGKPLPPKKGFGHHVVFIGVPSQVEFTHGQNIDELCKDMDTQEMIDFMVKKGNIAIYAHPRWSHVKMDEYLKIKNCMALEIYNSASEVECGCGEVSSYFEHSLWSGDRMLAIACDDAHLRSAYGGGWIVVKAKALTHKDVMDAIKAGSFYASTGGPEITDFWVEDGVAHVDCSPASCVTFFGDGTVGEAFRGEGITSQSWDSKKAWLPDKLNCIYAVCTDANGKLSWTQPVWLK